MQWFRKGALAALALLAALTFSSVTSFAGDLGGADRKNDSGEAVEINWSRYYLGLVGGYDRHSTDISILSTESKDWSYGIAIGASYRIPNTMLVAGIHADYMLQNNSNLLTEMDRSWSVVASGGVLMSPSTQLYVLAGYTSTDGSFAVPTTANLPDAGLTWGVGVETFLTKKLSARVEYRNVDLGSTNITPGPLGKVDSSLETIRFGLNYSF